MKVCILGGAGFIGRYLAARLHNDKNEVVVIDNYSTSKPRTNSPYKTINTDLTNMPPVHVREEIISADVIYHLASPVGVKLIDSSPKEHIINMHKMSNILLPLFKQSDARVIFASTSEVYGNNDFATEGDNLVIGDPKTLRWGYACNKLHTEFMLKCYDIKYTVVRFFNVTGLGQLPDHGMVLPTFIDLARNDKPILIYGDGSQIRTFCDIRDAVNMLAIISGDSHIGETYNIGNSANVISIYDLALKTITSTNSKSQIIYKKYREVFTKESKDLLIRIPNTAKIEQYYKCRYTVEDTIKSFL